jgi:hypothetical protein
MCIRSRHCSWQMRVELSATSRTGLFQQHRQVAQAWADFPAATSAAGSRGHDDVALARCSQIACCNEELCSSVPICLPSFHLVSVLSLSLSSVPCRASVYQVHRGATRARCTSCCSSHLQRPQPRSPLQFAHDRQVELRAAGACKLRS